MLCGFLSSETPESKLGVVAYHIFIHLDSHLKINKNSKNAKN